MDWPPGMPIDDYFFKLKKTAKHANAKLDMVCSIMISQMPKETQTKLKGWYSDNVSGSVSEDKARKLLMKAKQLLAERGLSQSVGNRSFNHVALVNQDSPNAVHNSDAQLSEAKSENNEVKFARARGARGRGTRERSDRTTEFKGSCYICGKQGHMMNNCPDKRCTRCGRKGHTIRSCRANFDDIKAVSDSDFSEESIILSELIEGQAMDAMLDTGAGPSVIDKGSLMKLGVIDKIKSSASVVYGLNNGVVQSIGEIKLKVELNESTKKEQTFKVIIADEQVLLLGRNFMNSFGSTEFDWEQGSVRLNDTWFQSKVMMAGGSSLERVGIAKYVNDPEEINRSTGFDVNPDLDSDQKQMLMDLLTKYQDCFADNPRKPSQTTLVEHVIHTSESHPIKQKQKRISPAMEEEINKQLNEMLDNDICRPSSSPWSSRVILVKKKDGSMRFVVDYRDLNDVTKKDAYPMPNLKDILDKINGSCYFSKMDMASAYWAVPIREQDKEKTAFSVPRGQYEMNVMAFGLCNSQATYQRLADKALTDEPNADSFVDDVLAHNSSFGLHLVTLENVFKQFRKSNLQMRKDKCKFGYYELDYVGHHLSSKGYQPISEHIQTIQQFPTPAGKDELNRFIGLVNYYRDFIPKMAEITEPLYQLLRKGAGWSWSKSCEEAFLLLKDKLSSAPVLAYPQWDAPFYIEADGSKVAVGGILSQENCDKNLQPVGYFSSSLADLQRNYSPSELECWVLTAATRKWRTYVQASTKLVRATILSPAPP